MSSGVLQQHPIGEGAVIRGHAHANGTRRVASEEPVVPACGTSEASAAAGTTGEQAIRLVAEGDPNSVSLLGNKSH